MQKKQRGVYFIPQYFNTANLFTSTLSEEISFIAAILPGSAAHCLRPGMPQIILCCRFFEAWQARRSRSIFSVFVCVATFLCNDIYGDISVGRKCAAGSSRRRFAKRQMLHGRYFCNTPASPKTAARRRALQKQCPFVSFKEKYDAGVFGAQRYGRSSEMITSSFSSTYSTPSSTKLCPCSCSSLTASLS